MQLSHFLPLLNLLFVSAVSTDLHSNEVCEMSLPKVAQQFGSAHNQAEKNTEQSLRVQMRMQLL